MNQSLIFSAYALVNRSIASQMRVLIPAIAFLIGCCPTCAHSQSSKASNGESLIFPETELVSYRILFDKLVGTQSAQAKLPELSGDWFDVSYVLGHHFRSEYLSGKISEMRGADNSFPLDLSLIRFSEPDRGEIKIGTLHWNWKTKSFEPFDETWKLRTIRNRFILCREVGDYIEIFRLDVAHGGNLFSLYPLRYATFENLVGRDRLHGKESKTRSGSRRIHVIADGELRDFFSTCDLSSCFSTRPMRVLVKGKVLFERMVPEILKPEKREADKNSGTKLKNGIE